MAARFRLGVVVATPGVLATIPSEDVIAALLRHCMGDWGDVSREDARANENALSDGSRIFSVFHTDARAKFWVITEAEDGSGVRQSTCVLLPSEY